MSYSEVELRDLWSYQLSLPEAKRELLIAHTWELLNAKYSYYFTSRNCAYHIAKMLELVTDKDLIDSDEPFVLPITVFQRLENATVEEQPIIKNVTKIASRQNRFRDKYRKLSEAEQKALAQIVDSLADQPTSKLPNIEQFSEQQ